jgi:putative addiction module component (TIGR02574 family)
LLREVPRIYSAAMASDVEKVEQLALGLSEEDRAQLAASLLDSLPGILSDQDDGVAEALRRDAELDAHPERAISLEELDTFIRSRRK